MLLMSRLPEEGVCVGAPFSGAMRATQNLQRVRAWSRLMSRIWMSPTRLRRY